MRLSLKRWSWALVLLFGIGVNAGLTRAMTLPAQDDRGQAHDEARDQANNQDYAKNKNYQQGMRDGQDDHKRNRDHSKKRHFKKDEDQKAYEAGYQQGFQGDERKDR
jgi:hypothetical protein